MIKMNLVDGNPNGLSINESCDIACAFASVGVDIIALSGGLILENGLYMLRGQVPLQNMVDACCNDFFKKIALFLLGPLIIPYIPYTEMFFRAPALCVLKSLQRWSKANWSCNQVHVCYIGGVQSHTALETTISHDGFDFVQSGRAILHDPNIVKEWEMSEAQGKGSTGGERTFAESGCTRCNKCIVDATMKQQPISCVEW